MIHPDEMLEKANKLFEIHPKSPEVRRLRNEVVLWHARWKAGKTVSSMRCRSLCADIAGIERIELV